MPSNYKRLGDYINVAKTRNVDLKAKTLLGINIDKFFMPSVANVVGTDMSNYKIVSEKQFACNRMHVGRDYRLPVALSKNKEPFMVSPAYDVFEIDDSNILNPEYLMMWFSRKEFDRNTWFHTDADVRGGLHWDAFCDLELPIPSIEKQLEIVKEYNTIVNRIKLNEQLNQKLEETAQAIYKHWFVDFEFPNENGKPYKSSGGEMVFNEELEKEIPLGWEDGCLIDIAHITMGQSPDGDSYNELGLGEIFYQGRTDFGFRFPEIRIYTNEPKRRAKKGDILMSVRAPVGDLNIANNDCCIGRGVGGLRSKIKCNSFLFYLLQEVRVQFNVSNDEGTIFGSITKEGLFDIKVIKASEDLIKRLENKIRFIDTQIKNQCEEIVLLEKSKNLILSKMTKL